MSELRRDPISGEWVALAENRTKRPSDFLGVRQRLPLRPDGPFSPGQEDETPPEIAAVRPSGGAPNSPGWTVRIIPNKYPAFSMDAASQAMGRHAPGRGECLPAAGFQDVVVATPHYDQHLSQCSVDHLEQLLALCQHRMREMMSDVRVHYTHLFQNHGLEAGASRSHTHLQIVGLPIVPPAVTDRIDLAHNHAREHDRGLFTTILEHEEEAETRVVQSDAAFVTLAPYGSRVPFEMRILPRTHRADFVEVPVGERRRLAAHLKEVLSRLKVLLDNPPYNLLLYTSPPRLDADEKETFRWHMDIVPRLTRQAGLEWGVGMYINPIPPERAAMELRGVDIA